MTTAMFSDLDRSMLEQLRERLQARGRRPSITLAIRPDLAEVLQIVEEYGPMCEAMYLMMAADRRLLDVEWQVLRGALDVLSEGRVRTTHMESMLDAAARRVAEVGEEATLQAVVTALADDPVRAETTVVLAAAVAAADGYIHPAEQELLHRLAEELGLGSDKLQAILLDLTRRLGREP